MHKNQKQMFRFINTIEELQKIEPEICLFVRGIYNLDIEIYYSNIDNSFVISLDDKFNSRPFYKRFVIQQDRTTKKDIQAWIEKMYLEYIDNSINNQVDIDKLLEDKTNIIWEPIEEYILRKEWEATVGLKILQEQQMRLLWGRTIEEPINKEDESIKVNKED